MIISKFKRELNGDISEITLNTKEVLKNTKYYTGEGTTKLYAWKNPAGDMSEQAQFLMTATEELTDDTKVFVSTGETGDFHMLSTVYESDISVSSEGITYTSGGEEYLFTRSVADDVDLF